MTAKILVVDDEPDIVELVSFNLKAEGFEVFSAASGPEALNLARAVLPDLIVLDLMLPDLDGVAVCEILHRLPSTAPIPIIMLTAWSSELARSIGLENGAKDYLTKPFSPRELVVRIRNTLRAVEERDARSSGSAF
jgi:two-component system alkaline phosphatase synthesis response regulator PhoP